VQGEEGRGESIGHESLDSQDDVGAHKWGRNSKTKKRKKSVSWQRQRIGVELECGVGICSLSTAGGEIAYGTLETI